MRRFAEELLCCGSDTLNFAAKVNGVEIRLKNLLLRPRALQRPRGLRLIDFLLHRAAVARTRERRVEHRSDLHRNAARAALRAAGAKVTQRCRRCGAQVHAAMLEKALVLGGEHCVDQRRRNFVERCPLRATHFVVHTNALNRRTIAVDDDAVAGGVRGPEGVKACGGGEG